MYKGRAHLQGAAADGFVEGECDGGAAALVAVEDARLGAHHQAVVGGLADPEQVVAVLLQHRLRQGLCETQNQVT